MTPKRLGARIEALIGKNEWERAQMLIEKHLVKEVDDHWLWARLSGVKYEQRDYREALEAAEKALKIVPDCPLVLWSKASALEMLRHADEALRLYAQLFLRALEQLKHPDEDANECWEGPDWTYGLASDCLFAAAGCLAKLGHREKAVGSYRLFLNLVDLGMRGIYSREDALEKLNRLVPNKRARRQAALQVIEMQKELIPN